MPERPILFTGPMVRAILEGRKAVTRRIVTVPPWATPGTLDVVDGAEVWASDPASGGDRRAPCPYGDAGGVLWVRETFADLTGGGFPTPYAYRADSLGPDGNEDGETKRCRLEYGVKWRPSIHMPRSACRLRLLVTGVRVERLQEITYREIICEGVGRALDEQQTDSAHVGGTFDDFRTLWDGLNAKRGPWESNPWVWVVSFERMD